MSTQASVGARIPEADLITLGTPSTSTTGFSIKNPSLDGSAANQLLRGNSQDSAMGLYQRQPQTPFAKLAEEEAGVQCQYCLGNMQCDVRRTSLGHPTSAVQQLSGRRGSGVCTGHEMQQAFHGSSSSGSSIRSTGRQTREQAAACSKHSLARQQRRPQSASTVLPTRQQSGSPTMSASCEDLVRFCRVLLHGESARQVWRHASKWGCAG